MKIALKDISSLIPEERHVCGEWHNVYRLEGYNQATELIRERQIEVFPCPECSLGINPEGDDCLDCNGHSLIIRAVESTG